MHKSLLIKGISLLVFCLLGTIQMSHAWPVENGVAVCMAASNQELPEIISDNHGGAIITWMDWRNTNVSDADIYAQAIDKKGIVKWAQDGVEICRASNTQYTPKIVSDGQGGAIITWWGVRNRNYDIFAQAIDSAGMVKWTANGIDICTAANQQMYPQLISDGQGGAIITWWDYRNNNWDVYAQAINNTGTVKWRSGGIAICSNSSYQSSPQIVTDGHGGAIIIWEDSRNKSSSSDIYAQAVDSTGTMKWTTDGVVICTASNNQNSPQLVSDGNGGAIVTWEDGRMGSNYDIYAQAINSIGTVKWTTNGVAICTSSNDQNRSQLIPDGQGGAVIVWVDGRNNSTSYDIYFQVIDSHGIVKWALDGIPICKASNFQGNPQIESDGQGGAIITWLDSRNHDYDIYAQAVNSAGIVKWMTNGLGICTAVNEQMSPDLISDGHGGAIIVWQDNRSGSLDIYAQSLSGLPIVSSVERNWEIFE